MDPVWPSPELAERPYGFYARLRREAPVWRSAATGEFLVSRWEEIARVTENPVRYGQAGATPSRFDLSPNGMAASDGGDHREKRAAAVPFFSRRSVAGYEALARRHSHALIEGFAGQERIAFWDLYARTFPARVLAEILGLPPADGDRFAGWFAAESTRSSRLVSEREIAASAARNAEARAYVQAALLERHRVPRDDVLSAWAQRLGGRQPWQALEYLANEIVFLFFAGYLPVANLVTSALVLLLQHPEVLHEVRVKPILLPAAIEEALRLDPPIQWLNRIARADAELGGVEIPTGSALVLLWASGNRDASHFENPDEFRLGRSGLPREQLGLGRGPHRCLGAPLVRLQVRVALETLLERFPRIELAGTPPIDHRRERIPQAVELELGS